MTTPRRLKTGGELSPCCPGPPDMAKTTDLPIEENEPHRAERRVEDGGDDGDPGDGHDVATATGDGGDGVNVMDPAAIVDGVLADLPEPARHHILPELEEHA